jgi:hypothetical protein
VINEYIHDAGTKQQIPQRKPGNDSEKKNKNMTAYGFQLQQK